jgi:hypothetical protein
MKKKKPAIHVKSTSIRTDITLQTTDFGFSALAGST